MDYMNSVVKVIQKSSAVKTLIYLVLSTTYSSCSVQKQKLPPPNILWITTEDNSPFLGCYGDTFATTPNLDKLASKGFLYTHAYANAPVCAPARNTIITGINANSGGNQHMRSYYEKSDVVEFFPKLLRERGYYCTNNAKEDYNIAPDGTGNIWDESGNKAHYKNRTPGQPFFAVFNSSISHESSIHVSIPTEELRHKPKDVALPPYHPDTPGMRHDWAQYYDKIEDMDSWVGEKIKELEESGEIENTIIFYYGDHGGVLARSKRYVYETGTRVPFIIYIPEKYRNLYPAEAPGNKIDRLISFVDLAPTLMSIAGVSIPEWMQGSAFLGEQKTEGPEYVYMFRGRMDERYDMSRAVRDKKYRYIKNYMPYRIYGQHLEYLWRAPSIRSWEEMYKNGLCNDVQSFFWQTKPTEELYDTENDPWEVNNLAEDDNYGDVLQRMRKANVDWMLDIKDTGFIPEAELIDRKGGMPAYDYMRSGKVNLSKLIETAQLSTDPSSEDIPKLKLLLKSDDSAIRYWAATGLLILKDTAVTAKEELKQAVKDPSTDVSLVAAEALYNLGEIKIGRKALLEGLKSSNPFARAHALNVIDCIGDDNLQIKEAVESLVKDENAKGYDVRMANVLLAKWDPDLVNNQ